MSGRASRARIAGFDAQPWTIDYAAILAPAPTAIAERVQYLLQTLPHRWKDVYVSWSTRSTNVLRVDDDGFAYLFDWYSYFAGSQEAIDADLRNEDRLVAAFGLSRVASAKRNAARQRGWVGPTETSLGSDRDKGHFIPHSIGGALEINLFIQSRSLNRGWSPAGKVYRAMEAYCLRHPGTLFFNRPIYADGSAQPALLEVGLLKQDGTLWIERFEN